MPSQLQTILADRTVGTSLALMLASRFLWLSSNSASRGANTFYLAGGGDLCLLAALAAYYLAALKEAASVETKCFELGDDLETLSRSHRETQEALEKAQEAADALASSYSDSLWSAQEKSSHEARKSLELEAALQTLSERHLKAQEALAKAQEEVVQASDRYADEREHASDFWRSIAASSASPSLDKNLNLETKELLGNGKYGYAFKCRQRADGKEVVVKLLHMRWSHLAVREWALGVAMVGTHANIVNYSNEVMLHADDDKAIDRFLISGFNEGKLSGRTGYNFLREECPDRYIGLIVEFMNRGTVQDWIDQKGLYAGGILCVMEAVAGALSYMHGRDVAHNDVKPENIFLAQAQDAGRCGPVTVKLGDLGNSDTSSSFEADYEKYGLTVLSMATYDPFEGREYSCEAAPDLAELCHMATPLPTLQAALDEVPEAVLQLWSRELTLTELGEHSWLCGWSFFDGEPAEDESPTDVSAPVLEPHGVGTCSSDLLQSSRFSTPPVLLRAVTTPAQRNSLHVSVDALLLSAKSHQCRALGQAKVPSLGSGLFRTRTT